MDGKIRERSSSDDGTGWLRQATRYNSIVLPPQQEDERYLDKVDVKELERKIRKRVTAEVRAEAAAEKSLSAVVTSTEDRFSRIGVAKNTMKATTEFCRTVGKEVGGVPVELAMTIASVTIIAPVATAIVTIINAIKGQKAMAKTMLKELEKKLLKAIKSIDNEVELDAVKNAFDKESRDLIKKFDKPARLMHSNITFALQDRYEDLAS